MFLSGGEPAWYALQVRPSHEILVQRRLDETGTETYLPTYKRKGWRKTTFDTPIFPGYVLARSADYIGIYELFRGTERWLTRIVGNRLGPHAIPQDQIDTLKLMLAMPERVEIAPTDQYKGGEEVEVLSGPLMGARGSVVYVKNKMRLVVALPMLGRSLVSAEMDAISVRPVNPIAA